MIHKFNKPVDPAAPYWCCDDIIVISDEAHRTQYGRLAINMRGAALPGAPTYIGFTGTPLFKDDEITRRLFGDYVSTYDFQRGVYHRGRRSRCTTTAAATSSAWRPPTSTC